MGERKKNNTSPPPCGKLDKIYSTESTRRIEENILLNHLKNSEDNDTENQTLGTREFAEHHNPCLHQYNISAAPHLQYQATNIESDVKYLSGFIAQVYDSICQWISWQSQ